MAFSPVLFGRRLLLSASFLNLNLNLESSNDNSCITFFQQVGFASLESGSVRAKNTRNVLLKVKRERERERVGDSEKKREREAEAAACERTSRTENRKKQKRKNRPQTSTPHPLQKKNSKTLIDKLVSGIVYWAFGFAFAFGDTAAGGLIGRSYFFLGDRLGAKGGAAGAVAAADGGASSGEARAAAVFALWFSSWVFLITATTIVSGCLAERARFEVRGGEEAKKREEKEGETERERPPPPEKLIFSPLRHQTFKKKNRLISPTPP